jgi:hypothetical protein
LTGSILNKLPTDVRRLEAESIYIFREVAAEFEKPVLLYSVGKDSSVLLHLARKAFFPSALPFPLLHIDTTWKFHEMIRFRDETAARFGLDLIVHVNREGLAQGINPFTHGSSPYTHVMKTEALKQALTPLDACERRDPKGLYKKPRRGELQNFTGLDSPYEPPTNPELILDALNDSAADLADRIIDLMQRRGMLS